MTGDTPVATPARRRARSGWSVAVALLLGAVLLVAGGVSYFLADDRYVRESATDLPGSRLQLLEGQGATENSSLLIRALSPRGVALAIIPGLALTADDFSVLEWRIDGLNPETQVRFIWAIETDPQTVRGAVLDVASDRLALADLPGWEGRVIGVGLEIRGRLNEPLTVRSLNLPRPRPTALGLLDLWGREWIDFDDWWGTSINFVAYGAPQTLLSPLPAAALWIALAGVLLGLIVRKGLGWRQLSLLVLIPWLLLDLRWQGQLGYTLDKARERYAGLDTTERARVADDGEFYGLMQAVRAALPTAPTRLLLVTTGADEDAHYLSLRGRYHLLPHKVLRLEGGRGLQRRLAALAPGDYLLVIGDPASLDLHKSLAPVLDRPPLRLYRLP